MISMTQINMKNIIDFNRINFSGVVGMHRWYAQKGGYYYTVFTKQYENLTLAEAQVMDEFTVDLIKERVRKLKGMANVRLVPAGSDAVTYRVLEQLYRYYVYSGPYCMGKVTIDIQQVGDSFNATIVYSVRKVSPDKKPSFHKSKYPYANALDKNRLRRREFVRRVKTRKRRIVHGQTKSED